MFGVEREWSLAGPVLVLFIIIVPAVWVILLHFLGPQ